MIHFLIRQFRWHTSCTIYSTKGIIKKNQNNVQCKCLNEKSLCYNFKTKSPTLVMEQLCLTI